MMHVWPRLHLLALKTRSEWACWSLRTGAMSLALWDRHLLAIKSHYILLRSTAWSCHDGIPWQNAEGNIFSPSATNQLEGVSAASRFGGQSHLWHFLSGFKHAKMGVGWVGWVQRRRRGGAWGGYQWRLWHMYRTGSSRAILLSRTGRRRLLYKLMLFFLTKI